MESYQRMTRTIVVSLSLILMSAVIASPVKAEDFTGAVFTGADLYKACTDTNKTYQEICALWISGFLAGV